MNFICWRIDTSVATENPSDCVLYLKIPCRVWIVDSHRTFTRPGSHFTKSHRRRRSVVASVADSRSDYGMSPGDLGF